MFSALIQRAERRRRWPGILTSRTASASRRTKRNFMSPTPVSRITSAFSTCKRTERSRTEKSFASSTAVCRTGFAATPKGGFGRARATAFTSLRQTVRWLEKFWCRKVPRISASAERMEKLCSSRRRLRFTGLRLRNVGGGRFEAFWNHFRLWCFLFLREG